MACFDLMSSDTVLFPGLKDVKFLLGSKSPRRRELLTGMDISFQVVDIDSDEIIDDGVANSEAARFLAEKKSKAFNGELESDILITADTVVLCNGELLNKPEHKEDAERMLTTLSGNEHQVITGVALRSSDRLHSFDVKTSVFFNVLSTFEKDYYIERYKPYDKAGAYGIQEWIGMIGISSINGCYYNVMGLPVSKLYTEICNFIK